MLRIAYCRNPVGNEDRRAAMHHGSQSLEDTLFRQCIDAGQGVVQDQQPWVSDYGAGNGDTLLLAALKGKTALANDGPVAVGERLDVWRQASQFGRLRDLFFRGRLHAPGDVFAQGRAEEEGLLRNESDLAPDLGWSQVAQIDAVHE